MPPAQASFIHPGKPADLAAELAERFEQLTGHGPAAVAAAPGRVNLIGEHLDYNGGRCLPIALPHATYAALGRREDRTLTLTSRQMSGPVEIRLDDLRPGSVEGWGAYVAGVVWALGGQEGWEVPGLDVVVDSRVPIGSGLSSSAALECAVAVALAAALDVPDSAEVRRRLAESCVRAEVEMAGAPTGGMDQAVALLGRAGHALLLDFADGSARQLTWSPDDEDLALLVVDTRVSHTLTDGGYASRRSDCESAARVLGVSTLREAQGRLDALEQLSEPRLRRRTRHVLAEMDRVDAAVRALEQADHAALGPLLDASHDSLRDDFEVSCPELDLVVETCRRRGALGARMTGAGFGGSAIALLRADDLQDVALAVTTAFEEKGWRPPGFLRSPASDGARRLR